MFQDPWSSLNPRMRVRDLIAEPMVINWTLPRREIQERVENSCPTWDSAPTMATSTLTSSAVASGSDWP